MATIIQEIKRETDIGGNVRIYFNSITDLIILKFKYIPSEEEIKKTLIIYLHNKNYDILR